MTKPDGLCGVSCGSSHIFAKLSEARNFRRQLNKHIVSHWSYYKNKINFPYERQVGVNGETAVFTEPFDFQNFLQSPDSDLLWTDTEEILAMCNQYQMTTTIIKIVGDNNTLPFVTQVHPDPDILQLGLPNTSLISSGKLPAMFLLLQGAHYELSVPRIIILEKHSINQN